MLNVNLFLGLGLGLWYLMPLSTIFLLYCGSQFIDGVRVRVMVFNATFNNITVILWQSVYWWID